MDLVALLLFEEIINLVQFDHRTRMNGLRMEEEAGIQIILLIMAIVMVDTEMIMTLIIMRIQEVGMVGVAVGDLMFE
jgi:hypothetical protein